MSDHHENTSNQTGPNPLMIQSYFDNELTSEEFAAISHDELIHSPTYQALAELRQVVRTESELALDDIDGYALLDAINAQIDAEPMHSVQNLQPAAPSVASGFMPKRRTTAQVFRRWAPALVGAALFLLSIPGFVTMFTAKPMLDTQTPTVVVIDSNGKPQQAQTVVQYPQTAQHVWFDSNAAAPQNPAQVPQNIPDSQLTIEEMDFALRHLINRIENLENAHTNGIETGQKALFPNPLPQNIQENHDEGNSL